MGFALTWLRQMSPLLHMTTLTSASGDKPVVLIQYDAMRKRDISHRLVCVSPSVRHTR